MCSKSWEKLLIISFHLSIFLCLTLSLFTVVACLPPYCRTYLPCYHFADWESGWLSICNSFHFKSLFCCSPLKAVPLEVPQRRTCNKQWPSFFPYTHPLLTSRFIVFPAASSASPHPCPPPHLFRSLPYLPILFSRWTTACCEGLRNILCLTLADTVRKHKTVAYTNRLTKTKG